jgi:hypothetical protein
LSNRILDRILCHVPAARADSRITSPAAAAPAAPGTVPPRWSPAAGPSP